MKKYSTLFAGAVLLLLIAACGSPPVDTYEKTTANRTRVTNYNLRQYAINEYDLAEKIYMDAYVEYTNAIATNEKGKRKKRLFRRDERELRIKFEQANSNYLIVMDRGLASHTAQVGDEIEESKEEAVETKAPIAAEEEYEEGMRLYNEAVELRDRAKTYTNAEEAAKYYDESINKMEKANQKFTNAQRIAVEKKEETKPKIAEMEKDKDDLENTITELELKRLERERERARRRKKLDDKKEDKKEDVATEEKKTDDEGGDEWGDDDEGGDEWGDDDEGGDDWGDDDEGGDDWGSGDEGGDDWGEEEDW